MPSRPHVLVLGGGYVPITLTRELKRQVRRGEVDVTVVSRDNFHTFHGFIGEMITGRIGPTSMLSPPAVVTTRACSAERRADSRVRA